MLDTLHDREGNRGDCLADNLVRKVAAQVALQGQLQPRSLSFKATLQVVRGGWQQLTATTGEDYVRLAKSLLRALRKQRVGERPGTKLSARCPIG